MNLALTPAERARLASSGAIIIPEPKEPVIRDCAVAVETARTDWMCARDRAAAAFAELRRAEQAYIAARLSEGRARSSRKMPPVDPYACPPAPPLPPTPAIYRAA